MKLYQKRVVMICRWIVFAASSLTAIIYFGGLGLRVSSGVRVDVRVMVSVAMVLWSG